MGKARNLVGLVVGCRARSTSTSETAEFLQCSRTAVVTVHREWMNRTANCGVPCTIDPRGECWLWQLVQTDRHATTEQVAIQMNSGVTRGVSNMTAERTLLHMGLGSRWLVTAPKLMADHCKQYRQFAQQYWQWTLVDWKWVAFSNEPRFYLHLMDRCWCIRQIVSENKHNWQNTSL